MKRRGEAPQGAPARVMGRRSLPVKGPAQPQGGHGCGVPHQRLAALHHLVLSRRAGLNGGREPSFSRSDQACPSCCLKREDVMHAHAHRPGAMAGVDPLRKPAFSSRVATPALRPDVRARCLMVLPEGIRDELHAGHPGGDVRAC